MMKCFFVFCLLLLPGIMWAQTCTTPGQNPATAFPVCGTSTFHQSEVPLCSNPEVVVPGCEKLPATNPFWYKFTCYASGTLGFLITPSDLNEDYDWQLFDITGHDPDDVFSNASLVVTANWAGTYGKTGTSDNGVSFVQCGSNPSDNKNTFAKMPQLVEGHTYLLLISHFTNTQSGYDLSFGGGTALINDPAVPRLKAIEANCSGDILRLKLGKNIICSSIASDGSDFTISSSTVRVTATAGFDCSTKFDTDSLILQLSAPLPPGNYTIGVKAGGDGNTLLDYCNNQVPLTDALELTILPKQPTLMDSLAPVTCAPNQLRLLFKTPIRCATIAADGTDFSVTGSYPVQVTGATGTCDAELTKEILLTLNAPLKQEGNFRLLLQRGSDGNPITDECGEEVTVNAGLSFAVKDTVDAAFNYTVNYGCLRDTISTFHDGRNGVTNWVWNLDDQQQSSAQNATGIYTVFNQKTIKLTVTNGFCTDSVTQTVLLDNLSKADFSVFADNCPNEPILFTGTPQGKIKSHSWEFGEGGTATVITPTYTYSAPNGQRTYNVRYTVTDSFGCQNTAVKPITIYSSCFIAVPTAFTPNGDGVNDFLAPLNAIKAAELEFRMYNRWRQLVYASANRKQGWNGKVKGQPQPTATYVWMLRYTNRDTGKKLEQKGTALLIR